jgi:rhodanese-related sulfurtransferase
MGAGPGGGKTVSIPLGFIGDTRKWRETIQEAVILAVAVICLALTANALSPVGISLVAPENAPAATEDPRFPVVSVAETKRMFDAGEGVFVDARSVEQYKSGHIPGACSLPLYQLDDSLLPFLDAVKPDAAVIVYCSSLTCEDSHLLAEELVNMGYRNVRVFAGGMAAWREKGYTVAVQ